MPILKKYFLFFIFLWLIMMPAAALAVDIEVERNPICWEEEDCMNRRAKTSYVSSTASGWLPGEAPCDKPGWGKCLPAGTSVAEISFGGKKEFLHIGDLIQTLYNYALSIVGILSAIVIIVAGVQWIISGGSSEMITSAKKRITGALIGLAIAFLSYAMLNVINPALVNLRLPQVYALREIPLEGEGFYCRTEGPDNDFCVKQKGDYACYPFIRAGVLNTGPFKVAMEGTGMAIEVALVMFAPAGAAAEAWGLGLKGIAQAAVKGLLGEAGAGAKFGFEKGVAPGAKKVFSYFITTPFKNIVKIWKGSSPKATSALVETAAEAEFFSAEAVAKAVAESPGALKSFGNAVASVVGTTKSVLVKTLKTPLELKRPAGAFLAVDAAGLVIPDDKTAKEEKIAAEEGGAEAIRENFGDGTSVNYVVSSWLYGTLNPSSLPGLAGICDKSHRNPVGQICNALVKTDCEENATCVPMPFMDGWVEGVKMGVCISGYKGSYCEKDTDCKKIGNVTQRCIGSSVIVGQAAVKTCSDGTFGNRCDNDNDCSGEPNLKCRRLGLYDTCLYVYGNGDVRKSFNRDGCFPASALDQPDELGRCFQGLTCVVPSANYPNYGKCTDGKSGSPCYSNNDCETHECVGAERLVAPFKAGYCQYQGAVPTKPVKDISGDCTSNAECSPELCFYVESSQKGVCNKFANTIIQGQTFCTDDSECPENSFCTPYFENREKKMCAR